MSDFVEQEPESAWARVEENQKLHGALLGLICARLGIGIPTEMYEKLGVKVSSIAQPTILKGS